MTADVTLFEATDSLKKAGFKLQENINLRDRLSLRTNTSARFLITLNSLSDFEKVSLPLGPYLNKIPILFLGGGSNLVLTKDFNGLVVQIANLGISKVAQPEHVFVTAEAGENWSQFVDWSCEQGLWGLENLALIPGSVGASPIQNIGAYGTELKDCFESLTAFHVPSGQWKNFTRSECHFAYRDSFFKTPLGKEYLIASVTFKLSQVPTPNLKYPDLQKLSSAETTLTAQQIAEAVKKIRQEKLPDPKILGNVGSFFKNPFISEVQLAHLQKIDADVVFFRGSDGRIKVPAAWLIDRAGWKGYREGNAGVHERQALVLVNLSEATGFEILQLAEKIQTDVLKKYGIALEAEPSII